MNKYNVIVSYTDKTEQVTLEIPSKTYNRVNLLLNITAYAVSSNVVKELLRENKLLGKVNKDITYDLLECKYISKTDVPEGLRYYWKFFPSYPPSDGEGTTKFSHCSWCGLALPFGVKQCYYYKPRMCTPHRIHALNENGDFDY